MSAEPVNGQMVVSWSHDGARVSQFRISREASASGLTSMAAEEIATVGSGAREFIDRTAAVGTEYVYSVVASGTSGSSGAAAAGPETIEPGIAMSVGINILEGSARVQCVVATWFETGSVPEDPLGFTVTRPDGSERDIELPVWSLIGAPLLVSCGEVAPASLGEYSLSIVMPGDRVATVRTATLHDLDLPDLPELDVEARDDKVVARWNAVAGAGSYAASLYSVFDDMYVFFEDTLATEHEFDASGLAPGEYEVVLSSYPIDRVSPGWPGVPDRYDITTVKKTIYIGMESCASPSMAVAIPDPVLLAAIRDSLGIPTAEISCGDMAALDWLELEEESGLRSLAGLHNAVNLRGWPSPMRTSVI